MTAQQLVDALAAAGLPACLDAAPKDWIRYAAVSPYAASGILGDSLNLCEVERVQIDVCAPSRTDGIAADVKAVLLDNFLTWETVTPMSYDPDFKLYRAILLLELY